MARSSNSTAPSEVRVPPALVAERRAGWHAFTRAIVWNSVAVAATLLLMLLVFRIL